MAFGKAFGCSELAGGANLEVHEDRIVLVSEEIE
jgi:hypothetical protein